MRVGRRCMGIAAAPCAHRWRRRGDGGALHLCVQRHAMATHAECASGMFAVYRQSDDAERMLFCRAFFPGVFALSWLHSRFYSCRAAPITCCRTLLRTTTSTIFWTVRRGWVLASPLAASSRRVAYGIIVRFGCGLSGFPSRSPAMHHRLCVVRVSRHHYAVLLAAGWHAGREGTTTAPGAPRWRYSTTCRRCAALLAHTLLLLHACNASRLSTVLLGGSACTGTCWADGGGITCIAPHLMRCACCSRGDKRLAAMRAATCRATRCLVRRRHRSLGSPGERARRKPLYTYAAACTFHCRFGLVPALRSGFLRWFVSSSVLVAMAGVGGAAAERQAPLPRTACLYRYTTTTRSLLCICVWLCLSRLAQEESGLSCSHFLAGEGRLNHAILFCDCLRTFSALCLLCHLLPLALQLEPACYPCY